MKQIEHELGPFDVLVLANAMLADNIPELPSLVRRNDRTGTAAQCRTAGRQGSPGFVGSAQVVGPLLFSSRFGAREGALKEAGPFLPGEPASSLFESRDDGEPEIERLRR